MRASGKAKTIAVVALVVVGFLYVFLVDLGVNAGRVHYGVQVDGFDIGGRTFAEAVELLNDHGREIRDRPVIYRVGGYSCPITGRDIGWGPQPHDTAEAAMGVGRPLSSIGSIGERVDAWLGGLQVAWADEADPDKVAAAVKTCHREAGEEQAPIDDAQVQALLGRFLLGS